MALLVVEGAGVGVVLVRSLGVWWVVWVLHVRDVRSLWSLAGCGREVRVGRGCRGIPGGAVVRR